jgi:hypothetical protein
MRQQTGLDLGQIGAVDQVVGDGIGDLERAGPDPAQALPHGPGSQACGPDRGRWNADIAALAADHVQIGIMTVRASSRVSSST